MTAEQLARTESGQTGKPIRLTTGFDVPGTVDNAALFTNDQIVPWRSPTTKRLVPGCISSTVGSSKVRLGNALTVT